MLRLQPGSEVTLFDGRGGEWAARIEAMGKREVTATALEHQAIERELPCRVTLALAMPERRPHGLRRREGHRAGRCAILPLTSERSVLRLSGERADKRRAHWQAIAVAACEQCGRNRVPEVRAAGAGGVARPLGAERAPRTSALAARLARCAAVVRGGAASVITLSGPEGGFTAEEEALALSRGFATVASARACCAPTPRRWPCWPRCR